MAPKPKPVPKRLGPPPQLSQLTGIPILHQQKRLQPKLREIMSKQAKMLAKWMHETMTWKKILMSWMVLLVASKMVLLMLTYEFFSLTALISLQIFHGVWTVAFFCLNIVDSRAILPNASCLLAGYLPATTVLHILLIPNDYPLEFIIIDAVGTFLAIITMFLLLRMECTEILHEAEELWQRQSNSSGSDSSSEVGSVASGSTGTGSAVMTDFNEHYIHASRIIAAAQAARAAEQASVARGQTPVIQGNRLGPTVIAVNGHHHAQASATAGHLDSMLYTSMDEPQSQSANYSCNSHALSATGAPPTVATLFRSPSAASASWRHNLNFPDLKGSHKPVLTAAAVPRCPPSPVPAASHRDVLDDVVIYEEAVDLEPIDFEHFIDEPELGRNRSERIFKVSFSAGEEGEPSPPRGRKLI